MARVTYALLFESLSFFIDSFVIINEHVVPFNMQVMRSPSPGWQPATLEGGEGAGGWTSLYCTLLVLATLYGGGHIPDFQCKVKVN